MTFFKLSCITKVAKLSYGVLSLFIIIKFLPLNILTKPEAGSTVKDVPATIKVSAL